MFKAIPLTDDHNQLETFSFINACHRFANSRLLIHDAYARSVKIVASLYWLAVTWIPYHFPSLQLWNDISLQAEATLQQ